MGQVPSKAPRACVALLVFPMTGGFVSAAPDMPVMPNALDAAAATFTNANANASVANTVSMLVAALAERLQSKNWLMATAESCTGGLIAAACTELAGSSNWFERGFFTYANVAKTDMLGVDAALIERHGAVSEAAGGCDTFPRPGGARRHRRGRAGRRQRRKARRHLLVRLGHARRRHH